MILGNTIIEDISGSKEKNKAFDKILTLFKKGKKNR